MTNNTISQKDLINMRLKQYIVIQIIHQARELMMNKELGIINQNNFIFQHYGYVQDTPNIATVNKELKNVLIRLNISPIITTKGERHTYGNYLWHSQIDLGVIAKILVHKDISMLVEVYGHPLQEKINDEFENIRKLL